MLKLKHVLAQDIPDWVLQSINAEPDIALAVDVPKIPTRLTLSDAIFCYCLSEFFQVPPARLRNGGDVV